MVRTLDALDEEASQLNIVISDEYEAGKYYRLTGNVRLVFNREVLGSVHVFRLPFHGGVFCDRTFKNAVEAARIVTASRSNGLWLEDAVNC